MGKIDLRGMSKAELLKLQGDIDKAIVRSEKKLKSEARAAAEAAARKHGFTLNQILSDVKPSKPKAKKKAPRPPKYRHPENSAVTWSGAGRPPAWVKDYTSSGKSVDDLLIKKVSATSDS